MPQKTSAGTAIDVDVDVDEKYIVEVVGISEDQAQWDNSKPGEMSLTWKFRVYEYDTGVAVIENNSNLPFEMWNFTGDKTYANPKTGKKAKAREWTEALIGRELSDAEMDELIDLGFEDSLMGKRGVADLEWYTTRGGVERLKIIRLRPYKKQPAAVAATAASATNGNGNDRAARRAALGLDDEAA